MNLKHILMMLVGCTLPLLLIFIAPLLGIKGDWSTLTFIIVMACHLFMPMHHGHTNHSKKQNHESHTH